MKARWQLSVGATAMTLALVGASVVEGGQRSRSPGSSGSSGSSSSSSGSSGGSEATPRSSGGGSSATGSGARAEPGRPRAVPRGSSAGSSATRPPEFARPASSDRNVVGRAVPRGTRPQPGGPIVIVRPRTFYPWGWGGGYFYDPFWWGTSYWNPYWGPSWGAYGGPGYWGPSAYAYPARVQEETGALRLRVRPREADVYVDGDFVGKVDDYDGAFQRLRLPPGRYEIRIDEPEHEPLEFSVLIVGDQTVTYRGALEPR